MKHTKEPWNVREHSFSGDCFVTAAIEPGMAYGPEIMGDDYTGYGGDKRKKADARRIVSCVNACAGIPTEDLERYGKAGGMAELRNIFCSMNEAAAVVGLTEQRDELLAAAKKCRHMLLTEANTIDALFRAETILLEAIAKAEK